LDEDDRPKFNDRIQNPVSERFTRIDMEVLATQAPGNTRFTRVNGEMLGSGPSAMQRRFSRASARILGPQQTPHTRFTRVHMRVLCSVSPNFEYIPMVYPDAFPYDISFNSVGSTRFATDVTIVDSGNDQRIGRWDQPLMEYDIAYGVRTMEQLQALIAFFRTMKGRLYAFCYQDWVDYSSSTAVNYEARAAPPLQITDQFIGTGDGSTKNFQLIKTYSSPANSLTQVRPITRPQPGTVRMAINGIEFTNFTVDDTTGIVTFTPLVSVTQSANMSKTSSGATGGGPATISGPAHTFDPFKPYIGLKVATLGWTQPFDNCPESVMTTILSVSDNGDSITLEYPPGYGASVETNVPNTTLYLHPAPISDSAISAGFLFFVPVRFDTDTLPVTLEDYGIGSSTSVKLIEVRWTP
jgi:uncharacterized protein (TIGR02217 family)